MGPSRHRSIIDNLFFCIAEPGDSVLIPAPYYPAFDNDLRAKVSALPLPPRDSTLRLTTHTPQVAVPPQGCRAVKQHL